MRAVVLLALAAAISCAPAPGAPPAPAAHRAILASFDALNEQRLRSSLPGSATPAFHRLFAGGSCALYARGAWPSKTSASHASIWTGVYGDSNGITVNTEPVLPRDSHRITDRVSGYLPSPLRAEPIWITAALAGRRVVALHATQSPGAPGYPVVDASSPQPVVARARAAQALALSRLDVLNGYGASVEPDRILTQDSMAPHPARGWTRLPPSRLPPLEIGWTVAGDSVFGLLTGDSGYHEIRVALTRDGAAAVSAVAAPADRTSPVGRALARYFSAPLALQVDGRVLHLRVRLFELSPDGRRFMLFMPAVTAVAANRTEVAAAYEAAVTGWNGNGAQTLMDHDRFGPAVQDGGSGEAEWRYLETMENVTRGFIGGSEWGWHTRRAELLVAYFPLIDEADHRWLGYTDPAVPGVPAAVRDAAEQFRIRAWQLADLRLAGLMKLAGESSNDRLYVTGDHGMRPTWRMFRPNAALRDAGLLVLDSAGAVDPTRTVAVAPDGQFVMLNRVAWRDGIVAPDDEHSALDRIVAALQAVRGPDHAPVVTQIWRVTGHDSLGRGGPVGGDIYYEVAPGYALSGSVAGPAAGPARIGADHGYPSTDAGMHTVLCGWGPGEPAVRRGPARTTDARGLVLDWLGAGPR